MICKPEEAEKLLCPFGRVETPGYKVCLADKCMAWRFKFETIEKPGNFSHTFNTRDGYCGLAGKPEGDY